MNTPNANTRTTSQGNDRHMHGHSLTIKILSLDLATPAATAEQGACNLPQGNTKKEVWKQSALSSEILYLVFRLTDRTLSACLKTPWSIDLCSWRGIIVYSVPGCHICFTKQKTYPLFGSSWNPICFQLLFNVIRFEPCTVCRGIYRIRNVLVIINLQPLC